MILLNCTLPDPDPATVTMGELCGQFNTGYVIGRKMDKSQAPGPWGLVYMSRRGEYAVDVFIVLEMPVKLPLIHYVDEQQQEGADACHKSAKGKKSQKPVTSEPAKKNSQLGH